MNFVPVAKIRRYGFAIVNKNLQISLRFTGIFGLLTLGLRNSVKPYYARKVTEMLPQAQELILPINGERTCSSSLWIFGYGSLIWKPNFEYSQKKIGYVKDYVRRFWQGCVSHRGVPGSPGRVATLVKEEQGTTWGIAFQLKGREQITKALEHLSIREIRLGDYNLETFDFFTEDGSQLTTYAFIASPSNKYYLGPAPSAVIARSIAVSSGKAGPNTEYLFRLVEFMREVLPHIYDRHLHELHRETMDFIKSNGQQEFCVTNSFR